ncbi:MAG: RND family transporter [Gammaproteobacteria bacterium]|nr:RND family transporter [Gammaproteobacteria bacterium]
MSFINLNNFIENLIFNHRRVWLLIFSLLTVPMLYFAMQLRVDAGFSKHLPLTHPYMRVFTQYQQEFGGANRILIALTVEEGDIFTPAFMNTLNAVTDEVFFIPGIDRTQVSSLFTPNVRFVEVVEGGFSGGNVIPADFQPSTEALAQVRKNVIKSGQLGRLVANDFSGAIVSARLLEINPNTGKRLDYVDVAAQLETKIRERYQTDKIRIHIIGFAKIIGDIVAGAGAVVFFFGIAFLVTAVLVYLYSRSLRISLLPLLCSVTAVIWQLGLLTLLGYGIDPLSMLVPFLVFAIGVSHGAQMLNAVRTEVFGTACNGRCEHAARLSFRRLLVPGSVALISDAVGFLTILWIEIGIIRELAITASLGIAVIILTNLFLLPLLLSYVRVDQAYLDKTRNKVRSHAKLWKILARFSRRGYARVTLMIAAVLFAYGLWTGAAMKIGDMQRGVPELHADSRYNRDVAIITERFSIGVDVLSVIIETIADGCIDYAVMETIDRFTWHMANVEGVQSVTAITTLAKRINAGWNEGSLKWRVLPRNQQVMVQAVTPIQTASGLLNSDCSVMPALIFSKDHKADTLARIVDAVKAFRDANSFEHIRFRLASGNAGVTAAVNETVKNAQFAIVGYVYAAVIILCLLAFRSWRATVCIILPLAFVSILGYALMSLLDIGLKVATLPVVALGVGIGVDYGIYLFNRLQSFLREGKSLEQAYFSALESTGSAVLLTGVTLATGTITWVFSPLKFQADIGILLSFLFIVNMLAAIILLPALASFLFPQRDGLSRDQSGFTGIWN